MSLNPRELGTTGATLIFLYGLPNDLPRHVRGKLRGDHPNSSRPTIEFIRDLVGFIWLPVGVQLVFIFYMARLVLNAHSAESKLAEPDTPWFLITVAIVVHWFHCFGPLPLGVRALMFVHDAEGGTHEIAEAVFYDGGSDEDPLPLEQADPAMTSAAHKQGSSTLMLGQSWALASSPGGDYGYKQLRDAVIKKKTLPGMRAVHDEVQTIEITVEGSHRPGGHHEWYVPVVASALIIFDKFLVPLLIVFIGGLFLCTSKSPGDLVLNSAAVVCINEIDEMIMLGGSYTSNLVWEVNLPLLPGWFRKWYSKLCREWAIVPFGIALFTMFVGRFVLML